MSNLIQLIGFAPNERERWHGGEDGKPPNPSGRAAKTDGAKEQQPQDPGAQRIGY
ncbi:Uu.00g019270.m01.CDS01 [Anthostomella pinea]|uniref:Uu.00g019270.m01.CDS01 n=1 Tax=Anthostomella pinea TaxID=933095 RepID=A0AAI8VZ97_9PEZI|nr:Uu.00g019270.m01.CDS01 [Anthostomella pinea]